MSAPVGGTFQFHGGGRSTAPLPYDAPDEQVWGARAAAGLVVTCAATGVDSDGNALTCHGVPGHSGDHPQYTAGGVLALRWRGPVVEGSV